MTLYNEFHLARLGTTFAAAALASAVLVAGFRAGAAAEATAAAGGPDQVLGLYLWYRADSLAGLKDGDVVTRWNDSGPRKIHLDKHQGSPVFAGRAINQLPVVRFKEGQADGLQTSAVVEPLAGNPNVTIFLVAKVARSQRLHVQPLGWGNGSVAGQGMLLEFQANRLDFATGWSADASTPDGAYTAHFDKPAILMCAKSAGPMNSTTRVTLNGTAATVTGSDIVPNVLATPLFVGGVSQIGYVSPAMEVSEIIIYGRLLSPGEQNRVGHYLQRKYRIEARFPDPGPFVPVDLEVRAEPPEIEAAFGFLGKGQQVQGTSVEVVAPQSVILRDASGARAFLFDCWQGGAAQPASCKTTVQMDQPKTITAVYKERKSVLYVAPNGRDTWSGALAEPNAAGTDGPFATLARARDAIRQWKSQAGGKVPLPVTVLVRGGEYALAETLTLTAEDSGAAKMPVVYRAYPGETPVLSSRLRIAGWKPWKEKILQADVPQEILARWDRRQLFLDGKRQTRARFPKADPADPWRGGLVKVEGQAEKNSYTAFKYPEGSFPRPWAKPAQAEVFMAMNWGYTTLTPLKSVDWQNRTMVLASGVRNFVRPPWDTCGWGSTSFDFSIPFFFYVENVLEELTAPGEWCVDAEARKVFFWPPGELTEQSEVSVPVLDCLIDVSGASWVTLDGFTFTGTRNSGNNMHRTGHHGAGAMYPDPGYTYCGEAVRLKQAEYCRIVNSRFVEVGGNAICVEGFNLKNVIQNSEFGHVGHCGITVIGAKDRGIEVRMPVATEIADNHIHHCGVYDTVAPGVFCGVSVGTAVRRNLIEQMPHHGINLGASGYGGNLVEYNRLRFCCMRNYDIGVINCWMEDNSDPGGDESLKLERDALRSGHVFRYNHISDTTGRRRAPGTHSLTIAIYLDNHTSNCQVYGNILECNHYRAVRLNGGRNNVVENNIIVDCGDEEGALCLSNPGDWPIWPQMKGFMIANRFCRNICLTRGMKAMKIIEIQDAARDIPRVLAESDYNLFFNADGGEYTVGFGGSGGPGGVSFAQWQEMGNDAHSRIADPLFVDAAKNDFRLKPESPALKLGFQPIEFAKIGPRAGKAK